ncbi:MAG TPA: hypothetical protein DD473_18815 [Planctomycetaceae bacterium]|nr:hypothetical protein [Planctomycetaceae bacterium]
MPRKPKNPPIQCEYFLWKLLVRNGVYYADGRCGNKYDLGKHSLNTRDYEEAKNRLKRLDHVMALQHNLTDEAIRSEAQEITITNGWERFMTHCQRPQVMGGASQNTIKRYRAVKDKHIRFCENHKLRVWLQVTRKTTEQYGHWLANLDYAYRSQYLELNLLVSVNKWLIEEELLPDSAKFRIALSKAQGSDTYCYTKEQVEAMVLHCRASNQLGWINNVIVGLATTGMRIGEFVSLRWSDIDLLNNIIQLTDERSSKRRKQAGSVRTIKGKRGRTIPLHESFKTILLQIPKHQDGLIFHGPLGGKMKPDVVRRNLIKHVLEPLRYRFPIPAGEIGFEHGRLHSFRHYFVSEAFRQNVTEAQIMEWVGHKDSEMIKLYRHLRADDGHRHMQRLNFGTLPEQPSQTIDVLIPEITQA